MKTTILRGFSVNKTILGVGFVFLILSFTSCKSGQQTVTPVAKEVKEEQNLLELITQNTPEVNTFSSKMKLTIVSKGKELSVNGALRMKKNEVIQLSLVPFLGIEVGRIEITPSKILILDRVNKKYVEEPISELTKMANTDMDFYTLQSLFTNSLFLPGNKELSKQDMSEFMVRPMSENNMMTVKQKVKDCLYSFTVTPNAGQLLESAVSSVKSPYKLTWKYADFQPFSGKSFPSQMDILFAGGEKPFGAEIVLSKLTQNGDWESFTTVSAKYKKMSLEELFKVLLGL